METVNFETLDTTKRSNIEWYLLTSLQPLKPNENPRQFVIDHKLYTQVMGFRRGFCIHAVLREINGESYAFHVASDNDEPDVNQFVPSMGLYSSFAELLNNVTELYDTMWNKNKK